jgi:D-2-hydroxyacid dehydrogenase (NADP+)
MCNTNSPTVYCRVSSVERAREMIRAVSPQSVVVTQEQIEANPNLRRSVEVIAGWANIELDDWPALRWVQVWSAGVSGAVCDAASRRGIQLTNTSGIHAEPIAEQALAMMLMFARRMHRVVTARTWAARPASRTPTVLRGHTLGVIGLGAIGRRLAELAGAFGMRVVGVRRTPEPAEGVDWVGGIGDLGRLMEEADYVFNVLPLTAETRGVVSKEMFAKMKPTAFYMNFGRGATQDTQALVDTLQADRIGGAGLDAHDPEPLPDDHPLWRIENAIITPHYAGEFDDYDEQALEVFVENIRRYRAGQRLMNLVDHALCY